MGVVNTSIGTTSSAKDYWLEACKMTRLDLLRRPRRARSTGMHSHVCLCNTFPSTSTPYKSPHRLIAVHLTRACTNSQPFSSVSLTQASCDLAPVPQLPLTLVIEVYRDTLVPASLVGLFSKLAGLLLSGYVGSLVDRTPRLRFVRIAIATEKVLNIANYGLFLVLFGPLHSVAQEAYHGRASWPYVMAVWAIIITTAVCSSITTLANTGLTVAVERDWVMTIGQGQERHLTLLNTYMRRIDLFSKLVAPVS